MKRIIYLDRKDKTYDDTPAKINLGKLTTTHDFISPPGKAFSRVNPIAPFGNIFPIPAAGTSMSFADASDSRAQELINKIEQTDLPVTVYWSGGIDSTLIVASIIKNFTKEQLNKVTLGISNKSYFENPYFFHNVIEKYKLKYASLYNLTHDYTDSIIVHGDPADKQWIQGNVLNMQKIHPMAFELSLRDDSGLFMDWLRLDTNASDNYLEWITDYILNDKTPVHINVETFADFYWWINFNYIYSPSILQHVSSVKRRVDYPNNFNLFLQNFFPWFHSDEYQLWSIYNRHNRVKFDGSPRSYKMPAKQYIYELDGNQRYRDFKTKAQSTYGVGKRRVQTILEDGTIIPSD